MSSTSMRLSTNQYRATQYTPIFASLVEVYGDRVDFVGGVY